MRTGSKSEHGGVNAAIEGLLPKLESMCSVPLDNVPVVLYELATQAFGLACEHIGERNARCEKQRQNQYSYPGRCETQAPFTIIQSKPCAELKSAKKQASGEQNKDE